MDQQNVYDILFSTLKINMCHWNTILEPYLEFNGPVGDEGNGPEGEGDSGTVGEGGSGTVGEGGSGASNEHVFRHFAPFAQHVQCHSPREINSPDLISFCKNLRDAVCNNSDPSMAYSVSI